MRSFGSVVCCVLAVVALVTSSAFAQPNGPTWYFLDMSKPAGTPVMVVFDRQNSNASNSFFDVFFAGFYYQTKHAPSGQPFTQIDFPGLPRIGEQGHPYLPEVLANLAIPTNSQAAILGSPEYFQLMTIPVPANNLIWPQPVPETDSGTTGQPEKFVAPDPQVYQGNAPWPYSDGDGRAIPSPASGGIPSVAMHLNPVHWDPVHNTLMVPLHVRYAISHQGNPLPQMLITKDTQRSAQGTYLNWASASAYFPGNFFLYTGDFLIVTPSAFLGVLTPFINQKAARGFAVVVQTIPAAGSTCDQIRSIINAWYTAIAPAGKDHYCLLVGDTGAIPFCTSPTSVPTDDLYGTTGSTLTKQIHVGRLSGETSAEIQNQVTKILNYEDHPFPFFDYSRDLLIAHKQEAPGKYEGAQESVRTFGGYAITPTFYTCYGSQAANSNATVTNFINNGLGIVCYRGHGSEIEWWDWDQSDESYFHTNVDALSNTVAPVVWSFACSNYAADTEDAFAEHWLQDLGNKGGVSHYSATVPSGTDQNHELDRQCHKAVFAVGLTKQSRATEYAESQMAMIIGSDNAWMYGLLGDPDMDIRRGRSFSISLVKPTYIPTCGALCSIQLKIVDERGVPIPGAVIGAYKPSAPVPGKISPDGQIHVSANAEFQQNAYSDANGMVTLTGSLSTHGWMYLAGRLDGGQAENHLGLAVFDSIRVLTPTDAESFVSPLTLRAFPSVTYSATRLDFGRTLDRPGTLKVFDAAGRVVRSLVVAEHSSFVNWDGRDTRGRTVGSGVYFVRLATADQLLTTHVVVIR